VAAIRRWYELYGEPPTTADWDPYKARQIAQQWRAERYHAGDWPSTKSVRNHFGRMSAAVAAAGLVPRYQGQERPQPKFAPDEDLLLHLAHLRVMRDGSPRRSLAAAIREVARAQASHEAGDVRHALVELAAAALAWAHTVE
jgi:hypothetical protein